MLNPGDSGSSPMLNDMNDVIIWEKTYRQQIII